MFYGAVGPILLPSTAPCQASSAALPHQNLHPLRICTHVLALALAEQVAPLKHMFKQITAAFNHITNKCVDFQ